MKVLHTADIHLKTIGDERWGSLESIVNVCIKEDVDLLVISGDLFDSATNAEYLRDGIRQFFSSGSFQTVIIPGNHDIESYQEGFYFGERVKVLNNPNWNNNVFEFDSVRVIGIPFENLDSQDLYRRLRELSPILKSDQTNMLLYHGELLDTFYSREEFGPDETNRYMPTRLSYFQELNVDYVLAGHFHTKFDIRELGENQYFVYSGSPVSITKKELGQRAANLFQIGNSPKEYPLDTFHYLDVEIELNPFDNSKALDLIRKELEKIHPKAKVLLTVTGYIKQAENKLVSDIKSLVEGREIKVEYQFQDISRVLNHGLYSNFEKILSKTEIDEIRKEQIRKLAIRGIIEAGI